MTIKGQGYADANGTQTPAKMSLTFKGATGITPNFQEITTDKAGYNIWLNSDGSTNKIERYDPWLDTTGDLGTWRTYQFTVHSYDRTSLYTTNADGSFLVTNVVAHELSRPNLEAWEYARFNPEGQLQSQGFYTIKFGTPITKDLDNGFYGTDNYGEFRLWTVYGTNVVIPRWLISEKGNIVTINRTNDTVTTPLFFAYSTNAAIPDDDGNTMPEGSQFITNHVSGLVTNVPAIYTVCRSKL